MEKEYWDNFYKKKHIDFPTPFVKFCIGWLQLNNTWDINKVYDFGCGNGRDTKYWIKHNFSVIGIDSSYKRKLSDNFLLSPMDLNDFLCTTKPEFNDIVYSRFFLHAISWNNILNLINWTKGYLLAEFRIEGDQPMLYTQHQRNFIKPQNIQKELIKNNFEILYYTRGYDLAKYKDENPLVARVIAKKLRGENK